MKRNKGIKDRSWEKPRFHTKASKRITPPRVAARMQPTVKNMRTRSKKNTLGGKK
ncbi:MAG TPA: hypothetical protein VJL39_00380 [Candidatus Paceibacterota bacterium]